MDNQIFWHSFYEAQKSFITPEKDGINAHIKNQYHKLESLLPPAIKAFSDNGIFFYIEDINNQRDAGVRIHFRHLASGQHYSQTCLVDKEKLGAQATGGCYTYAKRYLLASILLISDPKLDDDAEFATHGDRKTNTKSKRWYSEDVQDLRKQLGQANVSEEEALKAIKAKDWNLSEEQITLLKGRIEVKKERIKASRKKS
jgi:hypothetical protein